MSEPTRQYLFTENQVRLAFVASGVGMVSLLVFILILASAQPQGQYAAADTSQYTATVQRASDDLTGYRLLDNGRALLDIERAMELVAERGVELQLTSASVGADEATQAAAAQDTGGEGTGAEGSDAEGSDAEGSGTEGSGGDSGAEGAPAEAAGTEGAGFDAALGEQTYASCAGCHQANGQGVPGAFPPLAGGHMPALLQAEGGEASGREYLLNVLVYGLQGPIEVNGAAYNGVMPAWPQFTDEQIAAVLNHELSAWDNAEALPDDWQPYTADEVAAVRGRDLTAQQVLEQRQALQLP